MQLQSKSIRTSIVKTLAYSDIFDFPLTFSEIFKYYEGRFLITKKSLMESLTQMVISGQIETKYEFYFLPGRASLILKRKRCLRESSKKFRIAVQAVKVLKMIPTIKLIGISGSLASRNCEKKDDIDLFIVTTKNTLWTTRFFVNLILALTGVKRSTNDFLGKDKICPNMFLAEDALVINSSRRNIFGAREVVQLKALLNRSGTHQKFLLANRWVQNFLPNTSIPTAKINNLPPENKIMKIIDRLFYVAQLAYMSGKITDEEVKPKIARFHPKDKNDVILKIYNLKLKTYLSALKENDNTSKARYSLDTPGY